MATLSPPSSRTPVTPATMLQPLAALMLRLALPACFDASRDNSGDLALSQHHKNV
jgi:hypothetical protein